jgi:hypothetical protein
VECRTKCRWPGGKRPAPRAANETEAVNSPCPLCGDECQFEDLDLGALCFFRCAACTEFLVRREALIALAGMPYSWKQLATLSARSAGAHQILLIERLEDRPVAARLMRRSKILPG